LSFFKEKSSKRKLLLPLILTGTWNEKTKNKLDLDEDETKYIEEKARKRAWTCKRQRNYLII